MQSPERRSGAAACPPHGGQVREETCEWGGYPQPGGCSQQHIVPKRERVVSLGGRFRRSGEMRIFNASLYLFIWARAWRLTTRQHTHRPYACACFKTMPTHRLLCVVVAGLLVVAGERSSERAERPCIETTPNRQCVGILARTATKSPPRMVCGTKS